MAWVQYPLPSCCGGSIPPWSIMTTPKPGEVRVVRGGYGLMLVLEYDAKADAAKMLGHGPKNFTGHWFHADRLSEPVGTEVVLKERAEARARRVGCNNPHCWCRPYT